jgi:TM2 domain-containing membrane protein YozV
MTPEERAFLHQTSTPLRTVNRALVLFVTLLAGFWGGHKFLLGARREGWLYLLLSWTIIPLLASLGDFVDLVRQPTVGQGFLKRRLLKRHVAEREVIERATWKQLGRVLFLFLLFIAFSVWVASRMNQGHDRIGNLCQQIKPGTASADVATFASDNGLRMGIVKEGFNILSDNATMGRHSCHVTIQNGRVERSEHYFLD